MNVAAVNYYFRSKDALVAAALETSIRNMVVDVEDLLGRLPEDPPRVLRELLGYLLDGSLRYPRLSKAHLHEAFVNDAYAGPFPKAFLPLLLRLRNAIKAMVPGLDQGGAGRRAMAAVSAVMFPPSFSGLFRRLDALESAADRASYVHEIARAVLASVEPAAPASPNHAAAQAVSARAKGHA